MRKSTRITFLQVYSDQQIRRSNVLRHFPEASLDKKKSMIRANAQLDNFGFLITIKEQQYIPKTKQSSMKNSSRYVSNLDLKYLDSKFITIPDNLEVNSNLSDIRKSRSGDISSLIKTEMADKTLQSTLMEPYTRMYSSEDLPAVYPSRKKKIAREIDNEHDTAKHTKTEKYEIEKYRSLIKRIKSDNKLLQKEITNLYRQKKLNDNEPKTKPVKNIFKVNREPQERGRKVVLSPEVKHYNNVYERMNGQDNPYRSESLEVQKKISSTNLNKNFESFLQSRNKRIPQFIKNMR